MLFTSLEYNSVEKEIDMKRIISFILIFVICFGLCGCIAKSKYVGTYTNNGLFEVFTTDGFDELRMVYEMTLYMDGTGMLLYKASEDYPEIRSALVGDDGVQKGDILIEYALTWVETESYLVISGSGTNYTMMAGGYLIALHPGGTPIDLSETRYKLDGDLLIPISGNGGRYTKIG